MELQKIIDEYEIKLAQAVNYPHVDLQKIFTALSDVFFRKELDLRDRNACTQIYGLSYQYYTEFAKIASKDASQLYAHLKPRVIHVSQDVGFAASHFSEVLDVIQFFIKARELIQKPTVLPDGIVFLFGVATHYERILNKTTAINSFTYVLENSGKKIYVFNCLGYEFANNVNSKSSFTDVIKYIELNNLFTNVKGALICGLCGSLQSTIMQNTLVLPTSSAAITSSSKFFSFFVKDLLSVSTGPKISFSNFLISEYKGIPTVRVVSVPIFFAKEAVAQKSRAEETFFSYAKSLSKRFDVLEMETHHAAMFLLANKIPFGAMLQTADVIDAKNKSHDAKVTEVDGKRLYKFPVNYVAFENDIWNSIGILIKRI